MIVKNRKFILAVNAAFTVGLFGLSADSYAQSSYRAGNDFSDIARNITDSIAELPGLVSAVSYLMGLLFGVLGVLKIKDHVENPTNTKIQEGAIRLISGGALFSLPIVFESMQNTIGATGAGVEPPALNAVELKVK